MSKDDQEVLRIVGYHDSRHRASCAVYDPVPGACDCGATDIIPLVTKQQAEAVIDRLAAQNRRLREVLRPFTWVKGLQAPGIAPEVMAGYVEASRAALSDLAQVGEGE